MEFSNFSYFFTESTPNTIQPHVWFHNQSSQLKLLCNVCTKQEFAADSFLEHFKLHNTAMVVSYYKLSNSIIIGRKSEKSDTFSSDLSEKSTQTTECSFTNIIRQQDLTIVSPKRRNALDTVKQCKVIIKINDIEACRSHLSNREDEKNQENVNHTLGLTLRSPKLIKPDKFKILLSKRLKRRAVKILHSKKTRRLSKLSKFSCAVCEKKFVRMKELCNHMRNAHVSYEEKRNSSGCSGKSEASDKTPESTENSQHPPQAFDDLSLECDDLSTCEDDTSENLDSFLVSVTTSTCDIIEESSNDKQLSRSDLRPSRNGDFGSFENTHPSNHLDQSEKKGEENRTTYGAKQLLRWSTTNLTAVESPQAQDGVVDLRKAVQVETTQCRTNNLKNKPEASHEGPPTNVRNPESRFKPTAASSIPVAGTYIMMQYVLCLNCECF